MLEMQSSPHITLLKKDFIDFKLSFTFQALLKNKV